MIRLKQYFPYTYTRLPDDPLEDLGDDDDGLSVSMGMGMDGLSDTESRSLTSRLQSNHSRKFFHNFRLVRLSHRLKILIILVVVTITILLVVLIRKSKNRRPPWTAPIFSFDTEPRPPWMSQSINSNSSSSTGDHEEKEPPLSIRVAVLSSWDEVKRRQLLRNYMFKGVRPSEVQIDYRFLVGLPNSWFWNDAHLKTLRQEEEEYRDLVIMDFKDSKYRLSEKRYFGLKWSHSFSNTSYDYFMTLDSDTFVRFGALARRLPSVLEGKNIQPREQPVIIARFSYQARYWLTKVSDEDKDTTQEDDHLDGPGYSYPIGIGYMLSSSLVETLLSTQYPLPHHIHYPYDDIMIGSWLASLKNFADPSNTFTIPPKFPWEDPTPIQPDPLLPAPIDSVLIDDRDGWHDYPGRAFVWEINAAIGWNSVCVHHIKESEIQMMREIKEFQGEWDD